MTEPEPGGRRRKLRESMEKAEEAPPLGPVSLPESEDPAPPADPGAKPARKKRKQEEDAPSPFAWMLTQEYRLPDDCPVVPLGITDGNKFVFLSAMRQLVQLEARQFTKTTLPMLFAPRVGYLRETWPRWGKPDEHGRPTITGWDVSLVADTLMAECGRAGIWDGDERERGRGAHAGALGEHTGGLVLHTGRSVVVDGTPLGPGVIGPHVYPAKPAWIAPADSAIGAEAAAAELLALLDRWAWKRPHVDARLLLGWIASSLVGGALRVRPLVWVTGEKGTGKSTITERDGIVHLVHARTAIATADTSAAGIYQRLKRDTIPVLIDEIEARGDNRKTKAVVELARQAYSGGEILRGGADGTGTEFTARCSFLFSSINIPPLKPQDLSRMAILNLEKLPEKAEAPAIDAARLAETGALMLARWVARWHVWEPRFASWRAYLMQRGFDQRGAAQYGTLLAAADLMLTDQPPTTDCLEEIAGWMSPETVAEAADTYSDAENCAAYMASRVSPYMRSGRQRTVGELVRVALGFDDEGDRESEDPAAEMVHGAAMGRRRAAQQELERIGIKPVMLLGGAPVRYCDVPAAKATPAEALVAIATRGEGILKLFDGSDWAGEAGSYNPFTRALLRLEGAQMSGPAALRFAAVVSRAVLVPAARLVDVEKGEES